MKLHSFVVSYTLYSEIKWWSFTKEELENHHVLFQKDDKERYIKRLDYLKKYINKQRNFNDL